MKLEEIIHDISKILMQSDLSLESQKLIMEKVREQIDLQKKGGIAVIFGVDECSDFKLEVPLNEIVEKCREIWNNPRAYSQWENRSEEAFYEFLKFLWVRFSDGSEKRLDNVAIWGLR